MFSHIRRNSQAKDYSNANKYTKSLKQKESFLPIAWYYYISIQCPYVQMCPVYNNVLFPSFQLQGLLQPLIFLMRNAR